MDLVHITQTIDGEVRHAKVRPVAVKLWEESGWVVATGDAPSDKSPDQQVVGDPVKARSGAAAKEN